MIPVEKAVDDFERAELYERNAAKKLEEREFSKAGEFLWGAVAVPLNGIGVLHGEVLDDHRKTVQLGERIAIQRNDLALKDGLDSAEKLRGNYCELFMRREEEFHERFQSAPAAYPRLRRVFSEAYERRARGPLEPSVSPEDLRRFFEQAG